ncbi:hypothetical protein [Streptomyces ambofaciens]
MVTTLGSPAVRHGVHFACVVGDQSAPREYWQTALEQQPDAARKTAPKLRDKWVRMPADDASTAGVCDKQGFVAAMDEDESERRGMKRGSTTEVNGEEALELAKDASGGEKLTLYVATEGETVDVKELTGEQRT